MARSEQQKKDLKFKLYMFGMLAAVLVPVLALGPLLPKVLDSYRKKPLDPKTPERYLQIAYIQKATLREEEALATLKEFFQLFVDETEFDFSEVNSGGGEWQSKYYPDGLLYGEGIKYYGGVSGFTPWLFPDGKPAAVQRTTKEKTAEAILLYALIVEELDKKTTGYYRGCYIYVCLANMWPKGSEYQILGEDGLRRSAIRSF